MSDLEDITDAEDAPLEALDDGPVCKAEGCTNSTFSACKFCKSMRCKHHLYECHVCAQRVCMAHWAPSDHRCARRNDRKVVPEELPMDVMAKAGKAKEFILEATVQRKEHILVSALRMMYMLPPSRQMMNNTGLSLLLEDDTIWKSISDDKMRAKVNTLKQKMTKSGLNTQGKACRATMSFKQCRIGSHGAVTALPFVQKTWLV